MRQLILMASYLANNSEINQGGGKELDCCEQSEIALWGELAKEIRVDRRTGSVEWTASGLSAVVFSFSRKNKQTNKQTQNSTSKLINNYNKIIFRVGMITLRDLLMFPIVKKTSPFS